MFLQILHSPTLTDYGSRSWRPPFLMPGLLSILTFHAIDERPSIISVSPHLFRRAMASLHERGVRTLGLLEVVERLHMGLPFPPRSVALTFDDGYRSVYDVAFPVLKEYGMSATVFLTVGSAGSSSRLPSLEGRAMLSWDEIREMDRGGIVFGAHTCTHPDLTRVALERAEAEVRDSKAIIEEALGHKIESFAYPYGRYNWRVREIVSRHFACACSDELGEVKAGSDPHALERIDTYYLRNDRLMGLLSSRLYPWYIQARAVPRRIRRGIVSRLR